MPAKLSLNEQEICEKYKQGLTCYELADIYKCGFKTILRTLHRNKTVIRKRGISKLSSSDYQDILNQYSSNKMTVLELASKYKIHYGTISTILKENNIPQKERRFHNYVSEEQEKAIINSYSLKEPISAITKRYRISKERLAKILKKHDILYDGQNFFSVDREIQNKIVDLYTNQKLGTPAIEKIVNLDVHKVTKVLKLNGVKIKDRTERFWDSYSNDLVNKIIDMNFNQNKTILEISNILNMDFGVITRILKKKCKNFKNNSKTKAKFNSLEEESKIVNHYLLNKNIIMASRDFNCEQITIVRILKKHKVYQKTEFYQYNHDYFDNIDTHEKAYILGFLITDGCNHVPNRAITLKLHGKDRHIVETINKELTVNKPIKISLDKKRNTEYASLTAHSVKMSNRLVELGLPQAKTFKIKPEFWMQGEFSNSAILGMMDGDGSIYKKDDGKRKSWVFSFIGMRSVCEMMQNIFKDKLNIKTSLSWADKEYENNPDKPLSVVRVYGNKNCKILFEWLYKDCKFYLHRKYNRYQEMLQYMKERNQI